MTYQRFEELPVWQEAIRLVDKVYDMTESKDWHGSRSLRDQLERAALSVSNNIAEGFERGTTNELLAFIYIARGSAGEVRSMLCFIERRKGFAHFKSQISHLQSTIYSMLHSQRTTDKEPSDLLAASPFLRVPASFLSCAMRYALCKVA